MRKKPSAVDLLRIREINELLSVREFDGDRVKISEFINKYLDKNQLLMYSVRHRFTGERKCYFEVNDFDKERILVSIQRDINATQKAISEKKMAIQARITEINDIYNGNKDIWSNEYGYEHEQFRRKPYVMGKKRF